MAGAQIVDSLLDKRGNVPCLLLDIQQRVCFVWLQLLLGLLLL
jgi:hypothetical protein